MGALMISSVIVQLYNFISGNSVGGSTFRFLSVNFSMSTARFPLFESY